MTGMEIPPPLHGRIAPQVSLAIDELLLASENDRFPSIPCRA
jgi:hypothetical protein